MKSNIRVRFAPSPTGPLHIGGVRTALYNYLFAKKNQGTFILRIEDTDQTRYVKGAEEYIIESLKWCGIVPDEGQGFGGQFAPYRQSERKETYREYAEKMVLDGSAYYAFDTTEELDDLRKRQKEAKSSHQQYDASTRMEMKNSLTLTADEVQNKIKKGEPFVIRIKTPEEKKEIVFTDIIRGTIRINTSVIDDKILLKTDGMPTYHLANVVDDYLMKITHVIRGEEWLSSAPIHILLYQYLGWEKNIPQFAHLPLILKPSGQGKLSKRDGDQLGFPVFPLNWIDPSTNELANGYREEGYVKEAFINMLAFLGWNPGTEKELFSLDELVNEFSLEKVGKAGAKFDADKTKWFNQQYIKLLPDTELAIGVKPYLMAAGIPAEDAYIQKTVHLVKERMTLLKDILEHTYCFTAPKHYDEKTLRKKWKEETPQFIHQVKEWLAGIDNFSAEYIENSIHSWIENKQLSHSAIMPNLRLLITGQGSGPSLFEIMEIIGKQETITRLNVDMGKFV